MSATNRAIKMTSRRRGRARDRPQLRRTRGLRAVGSLVCVIVAVTYMLPLVWVVGASLGSAADVYQARLFPTTIQFENYAHGWNDFALGGLFRNSVIVTAGAVALTLAFSAVGAYGFVRFRSRGTQVLYAVVISGLMVPQAAVIVPLFVEMHYIGLYNGLLAVILVEVVFALPFAILILRGYVERVPGELVEAALVDGATEWKAALRVIFPLLAPALATVSLFTSLACWNDLLIPLVFIRDTAHSTLTVGLTQFVSQFGSLNYQYQAAAAVMAIVPLFALFVLLRRYYMEALGGALRQ